MPASSLCWIPHGCLTSHCRVTSSVIDLWSMPLQSCIAECGASTPPGLVGIFHSLQGRCQELNRRAHTNGHTDGWVRKQVLLVLVSRNARKDVKPLSR